MPKKKPPAEKVWAKAKKLLWRTEQKPGSPSKSAAKRGYNPNQPRHPAGKREGGEWKEQGAEGTSAEELRTIQEDAVKIRDALEDELGRPIPWDGKTRWSGKGETAEAVPEKGYLAVGRGLPSGIDRYQSLLHEMSHFADSGLEDPQPTEMFRYGPRPGDVTSTPLLLATKWGEGTAEGVMREYRPAVYRSVFGSIPESERAAWVSRDLEHPYAAVADALEEVREIRGVSTQEFWGQVSEVPVTQRSELFAGWARDNQQIRDLLFGGYEDDPYVRSLFNQK